MAAELPKCLTPQPVPLGDVLNKERTNHSPCCLVPSQNAHGTGGKRSGGFCVAEEDLALGCFPTRHDVLDFRDVMFFY